MRITELDADPYPMYERLRREEPVSWIDALGMWYVTGYADVRAILMDTLHFTTASEHSLIQQTFGEHMLTSEGATHDRHRRAAQGTFMPAGIRRNFEPGIEQVCRALLEGFASQGTVEMRRAFASRLPVQAILLVAGMPAAAEPAIREWYDSFEVALANFERDEQVLSTALANVTRFHTLVDESLANPEGRCASSLLATMSDAPADSRLADAEIRRNLSIIFFGGISTVEALILNCLWALLGHPEVMQRVLADGALLPKLIDETIRWLSPVQSATRHVVRDVTIHGVMLREGETVNCMLGAANRDPEVFREPERFDLDRPNSSRHLGFATGVHSCLGFNLAKSEARIALEQILGALPGLRIVREGTSAPRGYEFRQPRALQVAWDSR